MRGSVRFRRVFVLGFFLTVGATAVAALAVVSGSGAATAGPVLDHFECYAAASTANASVPVPFPATPSKVVLKNTFAPGGFNAAPGAVNLQCNPTEKTVSSAGHPVMTPVTNAAGHLLCRAIGPKSSPLPALVTLKNQFGTGGLKPIAVRSLCLPSWTTETTPPTFPPANAPPNLDAFVCYTVVRPKGAPAFKVPSSVTLKDQFGTVTTSFGAPSILCAPSAQTVSASKVSSKIVNPTRSSVCFAIAPSKTIASRTVYDKNQFGVGAVKLGRNTLLCVPSLTVVVPPPTTIPPTTTTTEPGVVTNFTDSSVSSPIDIVTGSDGALWFTNYSNNSIGRITTDGVISHYIDATISYPDGITAGPDGALWFTNSGTNSIGRITTAGVVTNYSDYRIEGPYDIAAGSDGALWFTNFYSSTIGKLTTDGVFTFYPDATIARPDGIERGPDGALWFANTANASIGRIDTGGTITHYPDPRIAVPYRVAAGPDGNVWFTGSSSNSVGYVSPQGLMVVFGSATISDPQGIWAGPDGGLWFANFYSSTIGHVATDGTIIAYGDPRISYPVSITTGPDGAMWFTSPGNNTIGRISV